jgi:phage-related protein
MPEAAGYRRLEILPAARKDVRSLPFNVRKTAGHNLSLVQEGQDPQVRFEPMRGIGPGTFELKIREATDTYRLVYVVALEHAVWVLDAFQKKSSSGRALQQHIVERLRQRYKQAQDMDALLT